MKSFRVSRYDFPAGWSFGLSHTPNPDDDTVIEVVPAPPPQRRPRTPNPAVDNVIHSGEIEIPRSMVVRSTSQQYPVVQRAEAVPYQHGDPTEPVFTRPTLPAPPTPRRFGRLAFLVAALAPAIAAIVLRTAQPAKPVATAVKPVEAESLAQLLGSTLDDQAHAAQLRSDAIASSSMLRAAIQTDAATLADMAKDNDVVFSLGKGERVVIYQANDAGPVPLFALPAGAKIEIPAANTARLELAQGAVDVVVATPVTKQGGGVVGTIALAAPIDLGRAKGQTFTQISNVALTGFGAPIALGGGPAAVNGTAISVPIQTTLAKGPALAITATLAAAPVLASDNLMLYARYACAALATLFLLMYVISVVTRR